MILERIVIPRCARKGKEGRGRARSEPGVLDTPDVGVAGWEPATSGLDSDGHKKST